MKMFQLLKIIFSLLTIICSATLFGAHKSKIIKSDRGEIVFKLSLDTVFVNSSAISVKPNLDFNKTPGEFVLPMDVIPLVGLPEDVEISFDRSEPMELKNFSPKTNRNEIVNNSPLENKQGTQYTYKVIRNDIYIEKSIQINGKYIYLLHINVIERIGNHWFWFKNTDVKLKWVNNSSAKIANQYLDQNKDLIKQDILNVNHHNVYEYLTSNNLIRIDIDSNGYFRIPFDSLYAINPSLDNIDNNLIQLFHDGVEQRIDVDPDLGIIFFGKEAPPPQGVEYDKNFYTSTNHYWLTWGIQEGLRYGTENVFPSLDVSTIELPLSFVSKSKFELNEKLIRLGGVNTNEQWDGFEHFFYEKSVAGGGNEDYNFQLSNPFESGTYKLTVRLQGVIDGFRRVNISLNDRLLGSIEWSGIRSQKFISNDFTNSDLINGLNNLYISVEDLDGGIDRVALDWIQIEYDHKYKVNEDQLYFNKQGNYFTNAHFSIGGFSNSNIIIFKTGETRLTDFLITESGDGFHAVFQDQIINESQSYFSSSIDKIPYPLTIQAVQPLEDLNNQESNYIIIAPDSFRQALEPMLIHYDAVLKTPESIYRTYSNGVISPYAIKEFLTNAYMSWSIRPEFVLIAHDKHIPAMSIQTMVYGSTFSDYWYALLIGDDYIPEVSVGRFPAKNKTELEVMVNKNMDIINSENQIWENKILMIAGYENEFRIQTEELIPNIAKKGFFPKRLYVDAFSENGPFYGTTSDLINYFQNGISYINFLGHGGGGVWSDRSLFTLEDFDNLNNYRRLPFVTSMTCFTGDVNNPNTLGKRMLSHSEGGAFGWFGSSGVGWIVNDYLLLKPIHDRLFNTSISSLPIGQLIDQSKTEYLFLNLIWPDIALSQIFQFNLLGDPGLVVMNYDEIEMGIEDYSLPDESDLELNIDPSIIDSFTVQILDNNYLPLMGEEVIDASIISLPGDIQPGRHTLVGVFKDQLNRNNHFSLSFEVDNTFIEIKDISPAHPVIGDSISFVAFIDAPNEILSVECWVDSSFHSDMIANSSFIYNLESKIPTSTEFNSFLVRIRVTTSDNKIKWSLPIEIQTTSEVDIRPISINLPTSQSIGLNSVLRNQSDGHGDYYFLLETKWDGDSIYTQLHSDSSDIGAFQRISEIFEFPLKSGYHDFRISVENKRKFIQDTTYVYDTTIQVDRFWITSDIGSTDDLIVNDTVTYNSMNIYIPPNIIEKDEIIFFNQINDIQVGDNQPSLNPILNNIKLKPISIGIDGVNVPWISSWEVDRQYQKDTSLYRFNTSLDIWTVVEGSWHNNRYTFNSSGSSQFAWISSSDKVSPKLEAMVDGQKILKGGYISPEPEIVIYIRDESDVSVHDIQSFKNGFNWDLANNFDLIQNGITTQIILNPILSENDRTMSFIASDYLGNISDTLKLEFFVSPDMKIIDYGNFPNPFNSKTSFSYELTRNIDDFKLSIYTVDGRKVREFKSFDYGINSNLSSIGYHEIIWNGRDEWGDEVANGVYFYKYSLKFEDKNFSSVGKVARSR